MTPLEQAAVDYVLEVAQWHRICNEIARFRDDHHYQRSDYGMREPELQDLHITALEVEHRKTDALRRLEKLVDEHLQRGDIIEVATTASSDLLTERGSR